MTHRQFPFRVTSKGRSGARRLPLTILTPYAFVVAVSAGAVAWHLRVGGHLDVDGYVWLALLNGGTYALVLIAVVLLNARQNLLVHDVPARRVWAMHLTGLATGVTSLLLIGVLAGAAFIRLGPPAAVPLDRPAPISLPTDRVFLGVYDPNGAATGTKLDVEQVFIQWKPTVGNEVRDDLRRILSHHRVPFVTIEPYPWNIGGLTKDTLLTDVAGGRYDQAIRDIADAVSEVAPSLVYLRFAHEMELGNIYPWQQNNPDGYIAMYRHFVTTVRDEHADNARFVWSPAGNPGATAYYPGADYVDVVGMTVLQNTVETFDHRMQQRYQELGPLGKPMVVCEYGVNLPSEEAVTAALMEARQSYANYPLLKGVIYFDAQQSNWPYTDWRLTPEQLAVFAAPV